VAEYDGAQHRELDQHTSDNAREEGFEDHGLVVARATSLDLWRRRSQLVTRLRDAPPRNRAGSVARPLALAEVRGWGTG
jgi:very-short-patch-repair endonuclease